jgi:hypothetical protein
MGGIVGDRALRAPRSGRVGANHPSRDLVAMHTLKEYAFDTSQPRFVVPRQWTAGE